MVSWAPHLARPGQFIIVRVEFLVQDQETMDLRIGHHAVIDQIGIDLLDALANQFREGTQIDRVVLDCVTSLQNGADMLWIETPTPNVAEIAHMVNRVKEIVPNAKLVYNNSPSFNWTLNFRQQAYDRFVKEGKDVSAYDRAKLMSAEYDGTELSNVADEMIRTFQADAAREAGLKF